MLSRLDHPPASFEQQVTLVGNDDLRGGSFQHMGFQRVGKVVDVDHRSLDPRFGEAV